MPLIFAGSFVGPMIDEVVVHHIMPVHEKAFFHGLQLLLLRMDEDHVGVAALADLDGRAGAHGDHVDLDAGLFLEDRQQIVKQPGILRAGGGRALDPRFADAGSPPIRINIAERINTMTRTTFQSSYMTR